MSKWSNLAKAVTFVVGATSGATAYGYFSGQLSDRRTVFNSWTTHYECNPCGKWDKNWDHRDPKSMLKPIKDDAPPDAQNLYNEALEMKKPKATRHLILIRHGQYNMEGNTDAERYLTELGRKQAIYR
jgi:serine/threonine-protein phosphatase PGAM5